MNSDELRQCVVDANVVLKLFIQQPGSDQADALFSLLGDDTRAKFFVPDLLFSECASAFARYARIKAMTSATARKSLKDLVGLELASVPTSDLVADALDLALRYQITGCDACYVALAAQLKLPLVTADERLFKAIPSQGFDLRLLSQLNSST
jgi:predicted nucleic acid-binding protein